MTREEAKNTIEKLVERFREHRDEYHLPDYNEKFINKILKYILIAFQYALIGSSICALVFTISETASLSFNINYNGFINFLKYSEPFSILYAASFVVITATYTIKQMELTKESNINFIVSNERNRWITFIIPFIDAIKEENYAMRIDLTKKLSSIHDYLHKREYIIHDKSELIHFYNTFLKRKVIAFEQSSNFWIHTGSYPNENHSFSFQTFLSVFILMIDNERSYEKFQEDLCAVYTTDVKTFSAEFINLKKYAEKIRVMEAKYCVR